MMPPSSYMELLLGNLYGLVFLFIFLGDIRMISGYDIIKVSAMILYWRGVSSLVE